MKHLYSLLIASVFMFYSVGVFAQSACSSGNSKFLATWNYGGKEKVSGFYTFHFKVYSVVQKSLIQEFDVRLPNKANLDSVSLSFNGKMLFVYQYPETRIYNVRTGLLVTKFKDPVQVAFAHQDNYFVVSNGTSVMAYDTYTAEELCHYQTAPDNAIVRLQISADDSHIFAETGRKQVLIWKKDIEKARKKFYGDQVVLKPDGSSFSVVRASGNSLQAFVYGLPEFSRIKKISLDKILRDRAREQTLELRKSDPSKRSVILRAPRFLNEGFVLNSDGTYLAFLALDANDAKRIVVLNIMTEEVELDDVVGTQKQGVSLNWYNDSLLVPLNAQEPAVYNARKQQYETSLDLYFEKSKVKLREKKQAEARVLSPDFSWGYIDQSNTLAVKASAQNSPSFSLEQHSAYGFSKEGKYLFIKHADGRVGYLEWSDKSTGPGKTQYFSEVLQPFKEDVMAADSVPLGLQYNRITAFKHIREAKPEDSLRIVMKTVEAGKKSGVQIQIIDKNGVYYYGAGDPEFRRIWCNLMVKGSDGKVRQIDNFEVEEQNSSDSIPSAVAMVLDFSGSMGWVRADAVQDGADKMIKAKKAADEFGIVKYDDRVVLVSKLNTNNQKLLRRLYTNDYSQFGGGTALLDATNAGIFTVKNAEDVGRKIAIVLTDGLENCSMATRNEVVANAIKHGVNIFTVGFGPLVDDAFLKSLSYTTYGGHYHIYQTPDFDWVFTDIYAKATNYYSVRYETDDKGSQVYLLKICLENAVSDSMIVEYDNNPADVALLLQSDAYVKTNPVKKMGKQIDLDGFDFPELTDFSKVKTKKASKPRKFTLDEDLETKLEEEFEHIELPKFNFYYDKTETVQQTEKRIAELARFLNKHKDLRLQIIGHTDNSGSIEYNTKLSNDRAQFVKSLLVQKGVAPERVEALGYGETSPIADNNTEQGRAQNRRVEFILVQPKKGTKASVAKP